MRLHMACQVDTFDVCGAVRGTRSPQGVCLSVCLCTCTLEPLRQGMLELPLPPDWPGLPERGPGRPKLLDLPVRSG